MSGVETCFLGLGLGNLTLDHPEAALEIVLLVIVPGLLCWP